MVWQIVVLCAAVFAIQKLNKWAHSDDRYVDPDDPDWTTGL